jgi:hypothetical protein
MYEDNRIFNNTNVVIMRVLLYVFLNRNVMPLHLLICNDEASNSLYITMTDWMTANNELERLRKQAEVA